MREQYLNDGIEKFDFYIARRQECRKLSLLILNGDYMPEKAPRILVAKSKGLCRRLVIPPAQDALVLQCRSDAPYQEIHDEAPTKRAFFEPKNHSLSKPSVNDHLKDISTFRFLPDGGGSKICPDHPRPPISDRMPISPCDRRRPTGSKMVCQYSDPGKTQRARAEADRQNPKGTGSHLGRRRRIDQRRFHGREPGLSSDKIRSAPANT
jgi:hypothetical protein